MVPKVAETDDADSEMKESIAYVRQMLGELRHVARRQKADLLCYLIEMAYVEAGDIQSGQQAISINHSKRN